MFWGLIYGAFWWYLGPQTLLPLFRGLPVAWNLAGARALLPSLIGHLVYGLVVAAVFVLIRGDRSMAGSAPAVGPSTRGAAAGCLAALLVHFVAGAAAGGLGTSLLLGLLAGAGYPLLFAAEPESTGPALARGTVYGFVLWLVVALTARPLVLHGTLAWSAGAASAAASALPGYILLGGGTAVLFTWMGAATRRLFVDYVRTLPVEQPGQRGLRATGYGAAAGLVGGLLFTVVMVVVGALPRVARMVGSHTPGVGLALHLVIAAFIGVSYSVVFRRSAYDYLSGIGWGVGYGFFWWVLGDLTLLPALDGEVVSWTGPSLAGQFPSLVGHLAYGAVLGAVLLPAGNADESVVDDPQRRGGGPRGDPEGPDARRGAGAVGADRRARPHLARARRSADMSRPRSGPAVVLRRPEAGRVCRCRRLDRELSGNFFRRGGDQWIPR